MPKVPPQTCPLTDYELGWLVGILEGEGYLGLLRSNVGQTQRVSVKMCDEDIVNRVAILFEQVTGKQFDVRVRYHKDRPKWNTQWEVYASGENARIIMRYVVKYMGYRRRKKIYQSLNGHIAVKKKLDLKELMSVVQGGKDAKSAS